MKRMLGSGLLSVVCRGAVRGGALVSAMVLGQAALLAEDTTSKSNETQAAESSIPIGTKLDSFELMDFRGKEYTLEEFSKASAVALVFLGTECPLVKFYVSRITALEEQFKGAGVAFIAVDPNVQDSLEMMASFARRHNLEMPFLKDPAQDLAVAVGATRTPEVVLLDGDRKVVYRGRIDDQWGIGYWRDEAQTTDLKNAIDAVLAGKAIETPEVAAQGCLIGRRKASGVETGEVTYANQISRLIQTRCLECHREGEIGPMDFANYEDVTAWSDMILEVVHDRRMPPWHANPEVGKFRNDRSLSQEEIDLLQRWVDEGTPLGDVNQLPEPPKFTAGWQLPREPDFIVPFSDEPYKVPAKGVVQYQHFTVKLPFTEDKWIQAMQVKPGNPAVVHHVLVFDRPAGMRGGIMPHRSFLTGFVPGTRSTPFPEGMAKRLPAGSELVFQVHYTPIGTEQLDLSHLGIVFVDDPSQLTHEIQTTSVADPFFQIPPGASNHPSTAKLPTPLPECEILSLNPHMHVRGKSFRMTAVYPDGNHQILVDVPAYDFNWQTEYQLAERLKVPAGTQIVGDATFDNSEENLNNPDPTQWITFGEQTWDEMMIGYFHVAIPIDSNTGRAAASVLPRDSKEEGPNIEEIFAFLDRNKDGKIQREELPDRMKPYFLFLDTNRDKALSLDEVKNLSKMRRFGNRDEDF